MVRATQAFPRHNRLLNRADFQRVFQAPLKSSDALFTVLARPSTVGHARLGLAIARKQLRSAVDRNRIKRLAREYFRQHTVATLDYVIMARKTARARTNAQIHSSLTRHFQRLAIHTSRLA
jgi:ribonuclease P protein component